MILIVPPMHTRSYTLGLLKQASTISKLYTLGTLFFSISLLFLFLFLSLPIFYVIIRVFFWPVCTSFHTVHIHPNPEAPLP